MNRAQRFLWQMIKILSIVVGFVCLVTSIRGVLSSYEGKHAHYESKHVSYKGKRARYEAKRARAVRVGMTRQQVEAQLRGWRVGELRLGGTPEFKEDYSYMVSYRGDWSRNYVAYDRNDRVVACHVYDLR